MDEGPKSLAPEDDCFLDIDEVILRLRNEFKYVFVDARQGAAAIDDAIDYYKSRKEKSIDADEHFDTKIDNLDDIREHSLMVILSDCKNYEWDYLTTILEPDKPLFFGFSSAKHEESALPLVERCAKALGYEIE